MQSDNRLLDDLSRLASGALGAVQGIKGEVDQALRQRLEKALAEMEIVSREEFEVVKAMASAAREENIRLNERLAALEARQPAPASPSSDQMADAQRMDAMNPPAP
jgi:BMFP domain-containing protein YqiC